MRRLIGFWLLSLVLVATLASIVTAQIQSTPPRLRVHTKQHSCLQTGAATSKVPIILPPRRAVLELSPASLC